MEKYARSRPRVVILGPVGSQMGSELSRGLKKVGISTFFAGEDLQLGEAWMTRIHDEIRKADVAVVVSPTHETDWTRFEREVLRQRISRDPMFVVIPVMTSQEEPSELPLELRAFQGITLRGGEMTPQDLERLFKGILSSAIETSSTKESRYSDQRETLAGLVAEGKVILNRLEFLENSARHTPMVYERLIFIALFWIGLVLCVVALTVQTTRFEYLLVSGSVLLTTGAVLALIAALRVRKQKQHMARLEMVRKSLEEVLDRARVFLRKSSSTEGLEA